MLKLYKKIIISILTGILLVISITPSAMAQAAPSAGATLPPNAKVVNSSDTSTPGPWYNQNFQQWSAKVFDANNPNEIFGERYTFAQVTWIIDSLTAIFTGPAISSCASNSDLSKLGNCIKTSGVLGMSGAIPALAGLANSILITKPASGIGYVKTIATRIHAIPQAYAQTSGGVGFNGLTPIVTLWTVVRDISYFLMIIVFIAMAFMIMFRVKISPQVIVSVQSALPKMVIALILITFSYAIAGFLVDLSYVAVGVFAIAIKGIGQGKIVTDAIISGSQSGVVSLFNAMISGNGLWSIIVGLAVFTIILFTFGLGIFALAGVSTITIGGASIGAPLFLGAILFLVLALIVFVIAVRVLWLLIKTACITVILIIVSPLMILMGVLSNSVGFIQWIRILAANLAIYPTVIIMLFLSHYFFWGWFLGGASTQLFGDNTVLSNIFNTYHINIANTTAGTVNLPGAILSTNLLGLILSFVILFLMPKAAEIISGLVTGKGVNIGAAIGEATNPLGIRKFGTGIAREAVGTALGYELYHVDKNTNQPGGAIPGFLRGLGAKGTPSVNTGSQPSGASSRNRNN